MMAFGEYLPDLAVIDNPGLVSGSKNALPRTSDSYGPAAGLSVFSNALTARAQGAISARDKDGNVTSFAGDATKLYKLAGGSYSNVSVSGGYTTPVDARWSFVQYGNRVMATNGNLGTDRIQSYVMGSSSLFATLASGAPYARYLAVIRDFVFTGNTYDGVDGNQPQRVWWSGIDDPTSWETPGSAAAAAVQSDFQTLPGGGWVQGIVGAVGGADGLVFCETSVYRVTFEGPPTVFRFDEIERARGTPAPGSIVNVGPIVYYLGEDGFYANNGAQSVPIGNQKVDKTFWGDVDQNYLHRITASADPINKLIFWSYPNTSANGTPNRILVYNYELNRWGPPLEVTCEMVYRALSEGYTLDSLDSYGTNLDNLPFSLDSRVWTGGRILMAAFDTSHKLNFFTGSNLAATFESGEPSGDARYFVSGVRPYVDGGTITASVGYREDQDAAVAYTSATSRGADKVCPQRISTRFPRVQVNVAAAGTWQHARGFDVVSQEDGGR